MMIQKTAKEKKELKDAKHHHKQVVRKAGYNPKKRINVSAPQVMRFTS